MTRYVRLLRPQSLWLAESGSVLTDSCCPSPSLPEGRW